MIGFCPYLRHEKSSAGISAAFELIAGTRVIRRTRDFLRLEQWQRPPEAPYFPPATFSECAWSWHLRFCPAPAPVDAAEDASGGFPQLAEGGGGSISEDPPPRPLDTLPSPVTDDMKDELAAETLNPASFPYPEDALVKSKVMDLDEDALTGAGSDTAGPWDCATTGPRRNLAWPVRWLRIEITFLNLDTVISVISRQSTCCSGASDDPTGELSLVPVRESCRMRCSIPHSPAAAASWMATCSSALPYPPIRSMVIIATALTR